MRLSKPKGITNKNEKVEFESDGTIKTNDLHLSKYKEGFDRYLKNYFEKEEEKTRE